MAGTWCRPYFAALWSLLCSTTEAEEMKQQQEFLARLLHFPSRLAFSFIAVPLVASSASSAFSSSPVCAPSFSSHLPALLRRGLLPLLPGLLLLLFLFRSFTCGFSRGAQPSSKVDGVFSFEREERLDATTSHAPGVYPVAPTEPLHLLRKVTLLQQRRIFYQPPQVEDEGLLLSDEEESTGLTNAQTRVAESDKFVSQAAAAAKKVGDTTTRQTQGKEIAGPAAARVSAAAAEELDIASRREAEAPARDTGKADGSAATAEGDDIEAAARDGRGEDEAAAPAPAALLESFVGRQINRGQQQQPEHAEIRQVEGRQQDAAELQRGRQQKDADEGQQQKHQKVEIQQQQEEKQQQQKEEQQGKKQEQQVGKQQHEREKQQEDAQQEQQNETQQHEKEKDIGELQGQGEMREEKEEGGQQKYLTGTAGEKERTAAAPARLPDPPVSVGSARSRNLSVRQHLASPAFSSVFSSFSSSSLSPPSSFSSSVESSAEESSALSLFPAARGFVGRQSHNIRLDSCTGMDVFLVSPLPSSLKKRFPLFAAREQAEGQGLPLLHHVHLDSSSKAKDSLQRGGAAAAGNGEREGDAVNPRLVVESSATTPLWTFQEIRQQQEGLPVVRVAEGAATIFRLSAPVSAFTDLLSTLLELPVMGVEIHADFSLALSYRLSATEGRMLHHTHADARHRPIADLDIQYLKCRSKEADELETAAAAAARRKENAGDAAEGAAAEATAAEAARGAAEEVAGDDEAIAAAAAHALLVNVTVWTHSCPAVSFFWRVVCAGNNKHIQEPAAGFHVGTTVRAAMALNVDEEKLFSSSAADAPSAAAAAARQTAQVLQLLTHSEGDVVADGAASELCRDVRDPGFVVGPEKGSLDLLAWCHDCKNGAVDLHLPSVAADLDVVYPMLHYYSPSADDEEEQQQQFVAPGVVPQQHLTVKNVKEGEQHKRIHRFRLEFRCRTEGTSIVAMEFLLHGARPIQVFLRKTCNAPVAAPLAADPTCATGLPSKDGDVCCAARCGLCGGSGCHDSPGGPEECCVRHIQRRGRVCALSQPPCLLKPLETATEDLSGSASSSPEGASSWPLQLPHFSFSFFSSLHRHTHTKVCALLAVCVHVLGTFLYGVGLLLVLLYLYTATRLKFFERMQFKHALRPAPQELLQSLLLLVGCMRYFYIAKLRTFVCIWRRDAHMYDALEDPGACSSSSTGLSSFSTCTAAAEEGKHVVERSTSSSSWCDAGSSSFPQQQHHHLQSIPLTPLTFSRWNDTDTCGCPPAAVEEEEEFGEERRKHTV